MKYETDHLRIAPDFDHPICEGTLESLEEHVKAVEGAVGPEPPHEDPVELYWMAGGVGDWCSRSDSGCFYPGTRIVFASAESIRHELVHAAIDATDGNPFVEEGLAEMLSGVGVYHRPEFFGSITAGLRTSRSEYHDGKLDYSAATHFLRFTHDQLGRAAATRLAERVREDASVEALQESVAELFQEPFRDVERAYLETAPGFYAGLGNGELDKRTLELMRHGFTVELRCDERETFGPLPDESEGMYRVFRVYAPSLQIGNLRLRGPEGTWLELIDPFAAGWRKWQWDWRTPKAGQVEGSVRVEAGEAKPVAFDRGTKLLMVASGKLEPVRVQVSLSVAH